MTNFAEKEQADVKKVSENDDYFVQNGEFCIKNEDLCIQNDEFYRSRRKPRPCSLCSRRRWQRWRRRRSSTSRSPPGRWRRKICASLSPRKPLRRRRVSDGLYDAISGSSVKNRPKIDLKELETQYLALY